MRTLTLNIIKGYGLDPVLNVSQFDKGYTVTATVQKGAESFTPPTGSTATVEGRKPDGTGYQYPATIDGSTVTFTVMEQMTVLSGRSMAEIVFYDADSVRIGTANFYLLVEEAPLNDNTVISETDLPIIQQALDLLKNGALAPGIIGTASGDVAAFSDGARDTALTSIAVNIAPVQSGSGDPSPTNIRPISGWDAVNVVRAGKNLLNLVESEMVLQGWNRRFPFSIKSGTYTISCQNQFGIDGNFGAKVTLLDDNVNVVMTLVDSYTFGNTIFSVTASVTAEQAAQIKYILFQPKAAGATYADIARGDLQLEPGSTATTYEPYAGETFPVTLPTEAGTVYGGVVDPVKGMLTVTKKIVDLGTLNWTYATSNTIFYTQSLAGENAVAAMVCSSYPYAGTAASNGEARDKGDLTLSVYTGTDRRVYIRDDRYTNGAAFKEAVTGQTLVYPLATPIEYDLTPTQIRTLYGYNTIYADCGGIESVEYTADTKMYIDAKIAELQALVLENA